MPDAQSPFHPPASIAIACGGTGGHLFPGLAVAEQLLRRTCQVTLMISPKDVDQRAVASVSGMDILTLPAVGLNRGGCVSFVAGFCKSFRLAWRHFKRRRPDIVLAMGGFISAPAVVAGKCRGAKTFLHEANSIPGRANRWLARWVDGAFVFFPAAADALRAKRSDVCGMPVRSPFFQPQAPAQARSLLGLKPEAPTLLVMGGSQGATKVNDLFLAAVPLLRQGAPDLQFMHLAGERNLEKVRAGYDALNVQAWVRDFFDDMPAVLAAADAAVSRAGASSLAELAARQLPAVLIPYPAAADNHQFFNARAFAETGAARMIGQQAATPALLANEILTLMRDPSNRTSMRESLAAWNMPGAAARLAETMLAWGGAEHHAVAAKQLPILNY